MKVSEIMHTCLEQCYDHTYVIAKQSVSDNTRYGFCFDLVVKDNIVADSLSVQELKKLRDSADNALEICQHYNLSVRGQDSVYEQEDGEEREEE